MGTRSRAKLTVVPSTPQQALNHVRRKAFSPTKCRSALVQKSALQQTVNMVNAAIAETEQLKTAINLNIQSIADREMEINRLLGVIEGLEKSIKVAFA